MVRLLRAVVIRGALLLGGLAVALGAAEVLVRVVDPGGAPLTVKDPIVGHRYRAEASANVHDDESDRIIEIRINSLGFRDVEHAPGRSSSPRVLVLGDSFVAGFAVDFEGTVGRVLQRTLRNSSDQDWEVMNFGVAAYGTAQELIAFEELGAAFAPDYVVLLFFAGNDVSHNSSELSTYPRKYYTLGADGALVPESSSELRGFASRLLNEHSRFYVWQKRRVREIERFFKRTVEVDPVHRVFGTRYDDTLRRAWDITRALLRELRDRVEARGARFLLVYVPYAAEVHPGWWSEMVARSPSLQRSEWDLEKPERLLERLRRRSASTSSHRAQQ
jgi:hypothetical protein